MATANSTMSSTINGAGTVHVFQLANDELRRLASFLPAIDLVSFASAARRCNEVSKSQLAQLFHHWVEHTVNHVTDQTGTYLKTISFDEMGAGKATSATNAEVILKVFLRHICSHSFPLDKRAKAQHLERIQAAACSVLNDPRGVVRRGFIALNYHTLSKAFNHLGVCETLQNHSSLLHLIFSDIVGVTGLTSDQLKNEERMSARDQEDHHPSYIFGDLSYKADHVTAEQQNRYGRAARADKPLGNLEWHPAVSFIRGWLLFKCGNLSAYALAAKLFEVAAAHPLLHPTCALLCALTKFHTVRHVNFCFDYPAHKISKWACMALADLLVGLTFACEADGNAIVEAPLMIETLSAIVLCLDIIETSFGIGKKLCLVAAQLSTTCHLPRTKLLAEATLLHNIKMHGCMGKTELEKAHRAMKNSWAGVVHSQNWETIQYLARFQKGDLGEPFAPYESCYEQAIWSRSPRRATGTTSPLHPSMQRNIEEMLRRRWLDRPAQVSRRMERGDPYSNRFASRSMSICETPQRPNRCQVCGQIARSRCSRCHKVWYCNSACQKIDWRIVHKKFMCEKKRKTADR